MIVDLGLERATWPFKVASMCSCVCGRVSRLLLSTSGSYQLIMQTRFFFINRMCYVDGLNGSKLSLIEIVEKINAK